MHKMLWFDCETTGTDPVLQDVIQIAGQVVIGGKVKEEFNLTCQPFSYDNVQQEALDTNKLTIEEIKTFPHPRETYQELVGIFGRYINKFNKADKFVAAGQNVRFDMEMTSQFFKKNGDDYFFSYMFPAPFDLMSLAVMLEIKEGKKIFIPNYKLETIFRCVMGREMENAHDALADIVQTREVATVIWKRLTG